MGRLFHVLQISGDFQFGSSTTVDYLSAALTAVGRRDHALYNLFLCEERVANMRQALNVREGLSFV